jgi:DNA-binding NarL/FixJ family response regulator
MNVDNSRPTAVVADDHAAMARTIIKILEAHCSVVAVVDNGRSAVEAVIAHRPDLVLLDLSMPEMNGVEACRQIQSVGVPTKIILLSANDNPDYVDLAASLGASFVLKNQLCPDLLAAVREVVAGRSYHSASEAKSTSLP